MTSNNPPYVVLELSEKDAKWLLEKMHGLEVDTDTALREYYSMSSSDPRSVMRATMTMRLASEVTMHEWLRSKMVDQQPELQEVVDKIDEFVEKKVRD